MESCKLQEYICRATNLDGMKSIGVARSGSQKNTFKNDKWCSIKSKLIHINEWLFNCFTFVVKSKLLTAHTFLSPISRDFVFHFATRIDLCDIENPWNFFRLFMSTETEVNKWCRRNSLLVRQLPYTSKIQNGRRSSEGEKCYGIMVFKVSALEERYYAARGTGTIKRPWG